MREGSILYKTIERFAPTVIPRLNVDDIRDVDFGKKNQEVV
jgi:hypothetical protein